MYKRACVSTASAEAAYESKGWNRPSHTGQLFVCFSIKMFKDDREAKALKSMKII
ncbi:hypothetical protein L0P73_08190 [[Clostridium] innocuum]|uniref:hypothetical protein n=1 Tax=Clostridium innocuum TaxID=1522 RepID=UPI001EDE8A56|nr:hypothetical protein [[Clostridium] innocuum]MCG4660546.1 hypothetical protein [[Clostridium] innocuum]MCR0330902.1 hypothetical protein [[Clostridium] innocuum]MCR0577562.1 hypothetical protein [[Clostridium] innocuum]